MAIKQIVGTSPFQDPQGIALALGSLTLDLSQPAVVVGSGEVAPTRVSVSLNSSGTFTATNLWANDQLSPSGTSYRMRVFNSNGLLAADMGTAVIQGASPIDVSALIPVTTSPAVSVSGVVFTNPTAAQTITGQQLNLSDNINGFFTGASAPFILRNLNAGASAGQAIVFGDGSVAQAAIKVKTGSGAGDVGSLCLFTGGEGGEAIDGQFVMAASGAITLANKFIFYNGIATVGNGVPSEVAAVNLTGLSAPTALTTIYFVPAPGAGMYRMSWVAKVTTPATTSSTLGGAGGFTCSYTDADDSVVVQPLSVPNAVATGNTTGTQLSGVVVMNCKASTNIQYQFGHTSSGATVMQYSLHIKLEAM